MNEAEEKAHRDYLFWKVEQEEIEARGIAQRVQERLLKIEDDILQIQKWVLKQPVERMSNE